MTERHLDLLAGASAIGAGLCWFAWAVANSATGHALEQAQAGSGAAAANASLTAAWNLLLIPAALQLYRHLRQRPDWPLAVATAAGTLSAGLWAAGGLTRVMHPLETAYLALAAIWLAAVGLRARPGHGLFGTFTLIVAGFTTLDAVFNLVEPVPFAIYVLAAPKLPLAAVWSVTAGLFLFTVPGMAETARSPESLSARIG